MNRTSKHPDRLSLRRLLLSASLVTRPTQTVSSPASSHISNILSRALVATFVCNKNSLCTPSHTRLRSQLWFAGTPFRRSNYFRRGSGRHTRILAAIEYRQAGLHRRAKLSGSCLPTCMFLQCGLGRSARAFCCCLHS